MADGRLARALARIDEVNGEDPRRGDDGQPVELLYGRRMSARLMAFAPGAGDALAMAVRAQHIARWRIPRDRFPEGVTGYKRWRAELGTMHGELAAEICREVGYGEDVAARVRDLTMKKGIKRDAEAQTVEDVACLVFLEHELARFAGKHPRDKVVDIVVKTLGKMSERGRVAAGELAVGLPDELLSVVRDATARRG